MSNKEQTRQTRQSFELWAADHKSLCITFPDYLPKLGVLSCMLNQSFFQNRDGLLLYDSPGQVRKELSANLPDEIFNDYQLNSIFEQALSCDSYLFIDNWNRWIESSVYTEWKKETSVAKAIFLMSYSDYLNAKDLQIDAVLDFRWSIPLLQTFALPENIEPQGLITLLSLRSWTSQMVVIPKEWHAPIQTMLNLLQLNNVIVTSSLQDLPIKEIQTIYFVKKSLSTSEMLKHITRRQTLFLHPSNLNAFVNQSPAYQQKKLKGYLVFTVNGLEVDQLSS